MAPKNRKDKGHIIGNGLRGFILGRSVSRLIFNRILNEVLSSLRLRVSLTDLEKESLYTEALFYFGVIGATNECEILEKAWKDRHHKRAIEEFIEAWLKRKMRRGKLQPMII
jgi:hypothetical protein